MDSNHYFDLVKGTFSAEECREVILGLINYKIGFHEKKSFGSEIRTGKPDHHSLRRIQELKSIRETLSRHFAEAERSGSELSITSSVSVETLESAAAH
jgi:hypothetical protein